MEGPEKKEVGQSNDNKEQSAPIFSTILDSIKKTIQLILLLCIINNIFGFFSGGGNSNVIFYSSTVYEKSFFNENGELVRLKKQNVRSNVPNIINNDNLILQGIETEIRENNDSNLKSLDALDTELDKIFRATIRNDFF